MGGRKCGDEEIRAAKLDDVAFRLAAGTTTREVEALHASKHQTWFYELHGTLSLGCNLAVYGCATIARLPRDQRIASSTRKYTMIREDTVSIH